MSNSLRDASPDARGRCVIMDKILGRKGIDVDTINIFKGLLQACRHCFLGQMSKALCELGGKYRRFISLTYFSLKNLRGTVQG